MTRGLNVLVSASVALALAWANPGFAARGPESPEAHIESGG